MAEDPKKRPTMTQVWEELEAAVEAAEQPRCGDESETNIVISIDGIGVERFDVEMDSLSFKSASLRCLETSTTMDYPCN